MKVNLMKVQRIIIRNNGVVSKTIELKEIRSISSETVYGEKILTINLE